jgi:hypothetical protein
MCYYDGRFIGTCLALTENSARDKALSMVYHLGLASRSCSAYSGPSRRLIEVIRSR